MTWHAYQRNGKTYLDIHARGPNGRILRVQRLASSGSHRLQRAQAEAIEAEIILGSLKWRGRTFADAAEAYLADEARSPSNQARIRRLQKVIGTLPLADIGQDTLNRLRDTWLMEPTYQRMVARAGRLGVEIPERPAPAPATVQRELVTPLSVAMAAAARRGWCAMPVFHAPRMPSRRTAFLLPDEARRLLLAAAPHLRPLILFRLGTGARTGESLALDWREVDLARATTILWGDTTKTGKRRDLALPPSVVAALASIPYPHAGAVFRGRFGEPYTAREGTGGQTDTGFAAAVRRAGLPAALTPHDLRHTWASWHYALHRDPIRLREAGGWSSLRMVETYVGLLPAGHEDEIREFLGLDTNGFFGSRRRPEAIARGESGAGDATLLPYHHREALLDNGYDK